MNYEEKQRRTEQCSALQSQILAQLLLRGERNLSLEQQHDRQSRKPVDCRVLDAQPTKRVDGPDQNHRASDDDEKPKENDEDQSGEDTAVIGTIRISHTSI